MGGLAKPQGEEGSIGKRLAVEGGSHGPFAENSREEGVCPICQERLKEAVRTDCGHLFCCVCLAQYMDKVSTSGGFCCPLCRRPFSEGVLGEGYICPSHQKKVCWFCEESRLLLCEECPVSPEHKSHHELAIKDAISHYKKRLTRRTKKLRKYMEELRPRAQEAEERLQALPSLVDGEPHRLEAVLESQQQSGRQLEDMPAEVSGSLDISRVLTHLHDLVTDLERTARELDANMLKIASDLLTRSAPQKLEALYPIFLKKPMHSFFNHPQQC